MNLKWRIILAPVLAAALLGVPAVLAAGGMQSANFSIPWSAVTAGSQQMASTHWQMQSTASLSAVGQASSSHFTLQAGYQPGTLPDPSPVPPNQDVYLPLLQRR